jgi:hypothetical protein
MDVKTIFEIAKVGGPASLAFFAILAWWLERKDRKELQKAVVDMVGAQAASNAQTEGAINALKEAVNMLRELLTQVSNRI